MLKKAEETSINILAITDHDSVNAHFEIDKLNVTDYYRGKIITGAEFNCVFNGTKIELLGYNFNKEKVGEWLDNLYGKDKFRTSMLKEFNDMVSICKKNNVKISENINYNPDKEYSIDVIYYEVIKYPENQKLFEEEVWNNRSLFFRKCTTDKDFILYRDFTKDLPTAEEVSKVIRQNGGLVFLAHLYVYKMDNHMEFLDKIVVSNILDGVECYYSKFTDEQIKTIETYCINNNLYRSGGSDCHGEKHPEIKLGIGYGNLVVDEEAINEWI